MIARLALLVAVVLAATACTRADPPAPLAQTDPAVAQAVIAPILTDPDLVSLDNRFAAMADPGPLDASLPPDDFAPETIVAARAEARSLTGAAVEVAVARGADCAGCAGALLDERARVLSPACAANLQEDLDWALRLPDDLPIYPKAHLREAVGSDGGGSDGGGNHGGGNHGGGSQGGACSLSGASFTAPVPAGQVLAFYRAMAAKAGFSLRQAGKDGLIGTRGSLRMAVLVRPLPGGLSHFDLLVAG